MEDKITEIIFEEDEVISGHETKSGVISFTWKDKEYEVDAEITEAWEKCAGSIPKKIEIYGRPKEIKNDDDWDGICEEIEGELG